MPHTTRIPNVDKLRGFAAMSVVLYHVIELTQWTGYPVDGLYYWGRIGWMGVDIFFVISGFVISLSAWSLFDRYGGSWSQYYWQRRLTRILPLYLVTMGVFITLVQPQWLSIAPAKAAWHGITHLLFVHNLFPGTHGSINGANWSIGVEMQFYLLVCILLPWIVRVSLPKLLATFFAIAWAWRLAMYFFFRECDVNTLFQYTTQLPGMLDEFALGIVLCKIVVDSRYKKVAGFFANHPVTISLVGVAYCAVMLNVFMANAIYWNNAWMVICFRTAIGVAGFALLIIVMNWPWRVPCLFSRPFDFIGEISYGLYLWHLPVILSLQRTDSFGGVVFLAKTVLATTLLATLSYFIFERQWMRNVRKEQK